MPSQISKTFILPISFTLLLHAVLVYLFLNSKEIKIDLPAEKIATISIQSFEPSVQNTPTNEIVKKEHLQKVTKEQTKTKAQKQDIKSTIAEQASPFIAEQEVAKQQVAENQSASRDSQKQSASNNSDNLIKKYLDSVRKKIQNSLEYPAMAKKAGLQGTVLVSFIIKSNGDIKTEIAIVKSSGNSLLDKSAIRSVKDASPFESPPIPDMEIALPVVFSLR